MKRPQPTVTPPRADAADAMKPRVPPRHRRSGSTARILGLLCIETAVFIGVPQHGLHVTGGVRGLVRPPSRRWRDFCPAHSAAIFAEVEREDEFDPDDFDHDESDPS